MENSMKRFSYIRKEIFCSTILHHAQQLTEDGFNMAVSFQTINIKCIKEYMENNHKTLCVIDGCGIFYVITLILRKTKAN